MTFRKLTEVWSIRELDNEADQLLSVQNALSSQLSSLESEIEALRSQLPALTSQRSQYEEVTSSISSLQGECIEMRGGANELSAQLLDDRKRLTEAKLRVDKIAAGLRSVEFASTRRQITGQLSEVLQDLANVGGADVARSNRKRLEQTRSLVVRIGSSTPKVMMILERAT
jgi:chromosome segregation ATPase